MKQISAIAALSLVGLLACEPVLQPEANSPNLASHGGAGRVVEQVTGSGQFTRGGQLRTFSFSAVKRADGTVTGEWQRFARAIGAKAHGDVTCFTINGNQVWLGGVVERTTTVPGEVAWTVIDNGEGASSAPDQISLQSVGGGPGFADLLCAAQLPRPMFDVEKGNIQIR